VEFNEGRIAVERGKTPKGRRSRWFLPMVQVRRKAGRALYWGGRYDL